MVETINTSDPRLPDSFYCRPTGGSLTPEEIAAEDGDAGRACAGRSMKIAQDPVSLETPIGEEEDSHLGDFIPDDDVPAPVRGGCALHCSHEQLMEVLDTLDRAGAEGADVCGSAWRTAEPRTLGRGRYGSSTSPASGSARSRRKRCGSCAIRAGARN